MADLDPLIKLKKFELNEKQRRLAQLYREQETMELRKSNLLDQLRHELQVMEDIGGIDALSTYTRYSFAVKLKVEAINEEISKIQTRIDIALNDIRENFSDLKKVEITQNKRLEEIAKENQKKEDMFFNEVAIERHYRLLNEEDHENVETDD